MQFFKLFKFNKEVLLSVIRNLLVFFVLVNIVATAEKLNAQDIINPEMGKIYFGYNKEPDSLLIDGTKVTLSHKKLVEVSPGIHVVKAYLSCYKTIEQTTEVKNRRVRPLRLKFKHLTTDDYDIYKNIRLLNYVTSLALVSISPLYEAGIVSLMPIGLFGLTGQIFWQMKQSSYFNHCDGKYYNPYLKKWSNKLIFGINSKIGSEYSLEKSDFFSKTYQTSYTRVRIERYLKKRITINPSDKYLSSYSVFLAYQRKFGENSNISVHTNFYPNFIYRAELFDIPSSAYDFGDPKQSKDYESFLLLMGLDFDYKMIERQNYTLYLSIGGFMTNTISKKMKFEVENPYSFDDDPPLTYINFSYSASGISAGAMMDYQLTDSLSFNTIYKIYFAQVLKLNNLKNLNILLNTAVNLVYNF